MTPKGCGGKTSSPSVVYDEPYGIYREFYLAIREQVHKLADMQKGGADVVT